MTDNYIEYIEFPSTDLEKTKEFYSSLFGWEFADWGEEYISFKNSGVEGGFYKTEKVEKGGPLVVLYHSNLEGAQKSVQGAQGLISKDIFSFPGGRRFHFLDPNGNKLVIWSDK